MVHARLLNVVQQGRHRYFRIASPLVGQMLEGMMVVAASGHPGHKPGPADERMRFARSCYDHLAGHLGVAIAERFGEDGYVVLTDDGGAVTAKGEKFFRKLDIDVSPSPAGRAFCRPCLDWSERRYHIAGTLGTRIMGTFLGRQWLKRKRNDRAIELTTIGRKKLRDLCGIRFDA